MGIMKKYNNVFIVLTSYIILLSPFSVIASEHEKHETKYFTPANNETFKQTCGACHFAYQPGLLPSESWEKILSNLPSHFGEEVILEEKSKNIIIEYLKSNSTERSSAKRAKKILKSLDGQTPLRITEIPYIREKHRELDSSIISKPSIGSRSNCVACHSAAEQGNYDDDLVKIPK
jgi:hypothetical protein